MIIKSSRNFKFLIGISAILISAIAALFSVTGISSLFRGAFISVVLMASVLEIGKIVVASYLARYWNTISKIIRVYLIAAVVILMVITSAGIFGYLSDAYQKTKGNYEVVDGEVTVLKNKKASYEKQIERDDARILQLEKLNNTTTTRLDSLNARRLSTYATELAMKTNNKDIKELRADIRLAEDSVGSIDTRIVTRENTNITGELGPLRFIAKIFNTDMDTVVKWFILALIFVFDPLAILLFVSLGNMLTRENGEVEDNTSKEIERLKKEGDISFKAIPADKNAVVQPTIHGIDTEAELNDSLNKNVVWLPLDMKKIQENAEKMRNEQATPRIVEKEAFHDIFSKEEIDSIVEEVKPKFFGPIHMGPAVPMESKIVEDAKPITYPYSDGHSIVERALVEPEQTQHFVPQGIEEVKAPEPIVEPLVEEVKSSESIETVPTPEPALVTPPPAPEPNVATWCSANFRGSRGVQAPVKTDVKLY